MTLIVIVYIYVKCQRNQFLGTLITATLTKYTKESAKHYYSFNNYNYLDFTRTRDNKRTVRFQSNLHF